MKLIDKDVVVAKIERRIKTNKECMLGLRNLDYYQGKVDALKDTISSLDTIEVKEVDLEKDIELTKGDYEQVGVAWNNDFDYIAKHFFELGLNTSNPLTWEDVSKIREIMFDYNRQIREKAFIPNNEDYCKELLKRFKAQKGG